MAGLRGSSPISPRSWSAKGHEVTLFASGDSLTSAELVACSERALRLEPRVRDPLPYYIVMLDEVRRRAQTFDVLHFHIDYLHFPLSRHHDFPRDVTTHMGGLDIADLCHSIPHLFAEMAARLVSDDQRQPCPGWHWLGTVHHGLPSDLYSLLTTPSRRLSGLSRAESPRKAAGSRHRGGKRRRDVP